LVALAERMDKTSFRDVETSLSFGLQSSECNPHGLFLFFFGL
jgi:hypothetical protein